MAVEDVRSRRSQCRERSLHVCGLSPSRRGDCQGNGQVMVEEGG